MIPIEDIILWSLYSLNYILQSRGAYDHNLIPNNPLLLFTHKWNKQSSYPNMLHDIVSNIIIGKS